MADQVYDMHHHHEGQAHEGEHPQSFVLYPALFPIHAFTLSEYAPEAVIDFVPLAWALIPPGERISHAGIFLFAAPVDFLLYQAVNRILTFEFVKRKDYFL